MTRASTLACVTALGGSIVVACGGSNDTGLFGSPDDATSSSGATASSSGTTESSGGTTSSSGATSSGGSSGTTSSGGSSGGSSGVVDAGQDTGVDSGFDSGALGCDRDDPNDCLQGEYCKVTSCGSKGVCTKKPNLNQQAAFVCGCDGISYWNGELAANFGVSVNPAFVGACQGGAVKTCSAINDCPSDRYCNYQTQANGGICAITTQGSCWGLPSQCPQVSGGRAKECNTDTCESFCEAVKAEKPWFQELANKCN